MKANGQFQAPSVFIFGDHMMPTGNSRVGGPEPSEVIQGKTLVPVLIQTYTALSIQYRWNLNRKLFLANIRDWRLITIQQKSLFCRLHGRLDINSINPTKCTICFNNQ
jgi:hypothetical protein